MKVILFGATGMVGHGVLLSCLADPGVESVLAIGRRPLGKQHEKLREIVREDLSDLSEIEGQLAGYDACFFCLGISSVGMSERDYRRVTYDLTMAAARPLARLNPDMTFIFVSGGGTDSTARGKVMWARVKGETENALLAMPFKAYMFRPAIIQPLQGVLPKERWIRATYAVLKPLFPVLTARFPEYVPKYVTTTDRVGYAMLEVARHGAPTRVLENAEIDRIGREAIAREGAGTGAQRRE
ncbi:epimerase [Chondromyces apiculatus]|uniref:Epimerase n=1 Tax=Chondromyces apiculatus DSM 436 TaxID=1192034 RepID=A0A017SU26_9BACT|nr:epimerase [Chondromyces apiculatus]EYF00464.1 Hypothetical protein CAP_0554 [Chondromyces apiculatus DSM 436]